MNLDEDSAKGGFKFKKRERKNRIKTLAEKPDDDDQPAPPPAAISITDIISQAHQTPSRTVHEHDKMGGSAEDGGDEGAKCEVNKEADKEGDKDGDKDGDKEGDRDANKEGESSAVEESATGDVDPIEPQSTEANGLLEPLDEFEEKTKAGPVPKKAPKFKQRKSKEFKSRPPKKGVLGFGDDIPGMDGLGTDITVICPWEAFSHLELHELSQFGII